MGLPGAAVALTSLWSLIPLTTARVHLYRLKRLAEIVAATGEDCPKVLRESLIRESYWVAAYRAERYTRKDKSAIKWLLIGAAAATSGAGAVALAVLEHHRWWGLACFLAANVTPYLFLPQTFAIYRWIQVRRQFYSYLGGRADIPAIPRPSLLPLLMQAPDHDDVQRWFNVVFGGAPPLNPKKIQANDMRLLQALVDDWIQNDRPRWPDRIAQEPRERAHRPREWPT
ncbi:hypothetical protein ACIBG0_28795 [Nocardia sp. NPDC050630]|uniref:hypothetical protein n=1 Tax=Nocardia sp. NPDC050630 TaxID=3364321 RepID=UPI0037BDDB24